MKSTFEDELTKSGQLIYTNVGTSMSPLLRQRSDALLITRPAAWDELPPDGTNKLRRLDIPLYKRDNGQYVLHRVLSVKKNEYVLCGDNRYNRETGISDRHVIGILSAIIRDGKEIPIASPKCRIYAHIWCDFFHLRALILFIKSLPHRLRKARKHD